MSESDSKRLEEFAHGAEVAEMELHNSFFKKWGIDATGKVFPELLLSISIKFFFYNCHCESYVLLTQYFFVGATQMPNCLLYTS